MKYISSFILEFVESEEIACSRWYSKQIDDLKVSNTSIYCYPPSAFGDSPHLFCNLHLASYSTCMRLLQYMSATAIGWLWDKAANYI